MFTQNGVYLDVLDDYQQSREFKAKDFQVSLGFLFVLVLIFSASVFCSKSILIEETEDAIQFFLIGLLILNLVVCGVSFRTIAVERNFLRGEHPFEESETKSDIRHNHVTGFGAAVVILLATFLVVAAVLGQRNYRDFTIPDEFGLGVLILISTAFFSLIFAPRITDLTILNSALSFARSGTSFLNPMGKFLSGADSWLVHVIAPISGVTERRWTRRYFLLSGNLVATSVFAWFGSPLFATISVLWAVLIAVSISRRWSWIESDRDNILRGEQAPQIKRVDIEQDLRDEALFALLFLIFVLPLGMRQFHQVYGEAVFTVSTADLNDPFAWFGFFGVEMIKALPFVDWSDIYGAHGATAVQFDKPVAMHLVFGARVLIDLVFLSALVQAISISVSLGKHKRRFLNKELGVTTLDPRIEATELSKLARRDRRGEWEFRPELENYLHYDSDRLSFLRIKCRNNMRLKAVIDQIFAITQYEYRPPGEKLAEEALKLRPDERKLMEILDRMESLRDFDLDYLEPARQSLNFKGNLEDARIRIAEFITKADVTPKRVRALERMTEDSWAPVRAEALQILGRNRASAQASVDALTKMANSDRAESLQEWATRILKRFGLWTPPSAPNPA